MSKVYSKALEKEIKVERYIGKFENDPSEPTVIVFGGIHGNEPSGVFALNTVCNHIRSNNLNLKGNFYALSGNLCALPEGKRYCEVDLNRIWSEELIRKIESRGGLNGEARKEDIQMQELLVEIKQILKRSSGEIYFIDLHSTSSQSCPFIPINDTMANRRFARKFPVPTVLGIEEFLDGPLLSFINEIDHIALGFEGGQHDEKSAIQNHIAFVGLVLYYSGCISEYEIPDYKTYLNNLREAGKKEKGIYEILHRYGVEDAEKFEMKEGFKSFDPIEEDQFLATYDGEKITAKENGKIFMPLYQNQGDDGFFIIRKVPLVWLKLSSLLRKIKFEGWLVLLPGISRDKNNPKTLLVNRKVARYLSKDLFHLLGFRRKSSRGDIYSFTRREKI
ncbi:MAG: aspartoacylase [Crocinitomicaceae bacterium]|nr:aspartoacylase [Crocinitomicaceae bacterium]|tara:strand:+ start:3273 stop:4445 length:1173 start_codon:yes stop_codon:yes gene_type:complete